MYSSVYQKLTEGGCIGIFPEGGSHDRTDLLPLKAGVSIMALGALSSNPNLRLRIVPVGLSYFHPHKFRSRAVVEFGSPIEIPGEWVGEFDKGGEEKKKAIGDVMELVVDGLKSVTIRAPDYETLMVGLFSLSPLCLTPSTHFFPTPNHSSSKPPAVSTALPASTSPSVKSSNSTNASSRDTRSTRMSPG